MRTQKLTNGKRRAVLAAHAIDALEARLNLSISPSVYEQYMIELINRARANPAAEAQRYGINLNEGLPANTISTAAKQPLALNLDLVEAVRLHVGHLQRNSAFSHTGAGGSSPQQRMVTAGYGAAGTFTSGENLAITLGSSLGNLTSRVENHHRDLFIDAGIAGRGHRTNMFRADWREIGAGMTTGPYSYNGLSWTSIVSGQNFAARNNNTVYLTGVAFNDAVTDNNFYTPGEGLGGITVTATNTATQQVYTTTTQLAGGYALALPAGTYNVVANGSGLGFSVFTGVVVGSQNVKQDFMPGFNSITQTPLVVNATSADDQIDVSIDRGNLLVVVNGVTQTHLVAAISSININALGGNDVIRIAADVIGATIDAGAGDDEVNAGDGADTIYAGDGRDYVFGAGGDDLIFGGEGNDTLSAGAGRNVLHGEGGDDRLNGSGGRDFLFGGDGSDRLYGNAGSDWLDGGGGVDRLWGGADDDMLIGGGSNDRLWGESGRDTLVGNGGVDYLDGGIDDDEAQGFTTGETAISIEIFG